MMAHELDNDLREREARTRYGRSFRELSEFDRDRVTYIVDLKLAEAAKTAIDPIGECSGVRQSQLDWIADRLAEALSKALDEDLPGLVRAHVQKALPDLAQPFITGSIAKSVGGGDRFDERLESHERRISRGADHLQRIEERLRKLEGKA
jgi:hypothetical protein